MADSVAEMVRLRLDETAAATRRMSHRVEEILEWSDAFADALAADHRLLVVGNGGGCALAEHFTAELVGTYNGERPPWDVMSLQTSSATLTAISNDQGFEDSAAREVLAHGRVGDILVCISASGQSQNILSAARAARAQGMRPYVLLGRSVAPIRDIAERVLAVEADDVATVQELQLMVLHAICDGLSAGWDTRIASDAAGV